MYRKLVFVLTMFAVAFGSLSGVQAALASSRPAAPVASAAHAGTSASIATLRATGAVRAATAGRQMAHDARLRTEQRQGSLPLSGDRRATGTASAHKSTRPASLAAPKKPALSEQRGLPIFSIPPVHLYRRPIHAFTSLPARRPAEWPTTRSHALVRRGRRPAVGSHVHRQRVQLRRHFREHRLRVPPARTRSRSPRRTVARVYRTLILHPHGRPGVPDHQLCWHHLHRRPGRDLYRHVDRVPNVRIVRDAAPAVGSHVHRQRGRHGDTCGNTTCGSGGTYPFTITATNGGTPSATQTFTLTVNRGVPDRTALPTYNIPFGPAGAGTSLPSPPRPGCPRALCPRRAPAVGSNVQTRARGHLRKQRLRPPPPEHTRSRSPLRTSSLTPPRPSPSRSALACHHPSPDLATTFIAGQAGTFTVTSTGSPTCALSATTSAAPNCRRGSRSRTTGTARRPLREHRLRAPAAAVTRSRSPPRTVSVLPPPPSPSLTVDASSTTPTSCSTHHQPSIGHLYGRPGRDARYLHVADHVTNGVPRCALSATGVCRPESR